MSTLEGLRKRYKSGGADGAKLRAYVIDVAHKAGVAAIDVVYKHAKSNSVLEYFIIERMIKMLLDHQVASKRHL